MKGIIILALLFVLSLANGQTVQTGQNDMITAKSHMSENEARAVQEGASRHYKLPVELSVSLGEGVEMDFVLIPEGSFFMGNQISQEELAIIYDLHVEHFDLEYPGHMVTLTRPFYMAKFEVSQKQWERFMDNNPSRTRGEHIPVEYVSWEECVDYCSIVSEAIQREIRLPTEAEWEYACRAGTRTAYNFGDTLSSEYTNCNLGHPVPVGSYPPNRWGLYDMHGNVLEWVNDYYGGYSDEHQVDPVGPDEHFGVMCRGGGSTSDPTSFRSAHRHAHLKTTGDQGPGFRVVLPITFDQ
jgi:formylglycine-generating enzyme required for sulfatase activity